MSDAMDHFVLFEGFRHQLQTSIDRYNGVIAGNIDREFLLSRRIEFNLHLIEELRQQIRIMRRMKGEEVEPETLFAAVTLEGRIGGFL